MHLHNGSKKKNFLEKLHACNSLSRKQSSAQCVSCLTGCVQKEQHLCDYTSPEACKKNRKGKETSQRSKPHLTSVPFQMSTATNPRYITDARTAPTYTVEKAKCEDCFSGRGSICDEAKFWPLDSSCCFYDFLKCRCGDGEARRHFIYG